ncbi:MAG: WYL domain-containing protein [Spirochaetaceae bacterium]|jgi:predicted DNA-binding transcriptional regulator YafY|nr:WYL domain-containing protein [Spirochaetaceae bacterium]
MKTRTSFPRTSLPRIYFIDARIASGQYPNTAGLAREYEVSESTISRDIELMRDRLNAPIEYNALNRGYYYTEKTYRLPAGYVSAQDMFALGMVKNLLALYRNTPLYDAAAQLMESITAPLTADNGSRWYEDRVVVPPAPSIILPPNVWETIISALRQNRIITFEYTGIWNNQTEKRRVRPYQLLFDSGVWYLYGYAEERKAARIFSLPRIHHISLTEDRFTLPADFDYRKQDDTSYFGVFAGEKRQKFLIAFYDESAIWVLDRHWAADQKTEESDGGVLIRFSSTQYQKVLEWVLSRGCTAEPLEPQELVKDWKRHITGLRKLAGRR